MTDHEIIAILKSERPQKGLRELYKQFPTVKRFITKHGGNNDDANDIFQDAILITYEKVINTDFQLTSALSTYIFSIAKYKWKDALIAKNKLNNYINEFTEEEIIPTSEEEKFNFAENALLQIGEKCQAILVAFYHQKFSMTLIAEKFGFTSENVAKNQKYKCLEKAREAYKSFLNPSNC